MCERAWHLMIMQRIITSEAVPEWKLPVSHGSRSLVLIPRFLPSAEIVYTRLDN